MTVKRWYWQSFQWNHWSQHWLKESVWCHLSGSVYQVKTHSMERNACSGSNLYENRQTASIHTKAPVKSLPLAWSIIYESDAHSTYWSEVLSTQVRLLCFDNDLFDVISVHWFDLFQSLSIQLQIDGLKRHFENIYSVATRAFFYYYGSILSTRNILKMNFSVFYEAMIASIVVV